MTKTEMAAMRKETKVLQGSLKSLLRSAGDDLGCDGTGEEAKGLREQIRANLAALAYAGDRKPLEAAVWAKTHRDYRGYHGAPCAENRSILMLIPGAGTCLCLLAKLPIPDLMERV